MDNLIAKRLKRRIDRESDSVTVLSIEPWRKGRGGTGHSWQLHCRTEDGREFRLRSERQWEQWREELFGGPSGDTSPMFIMNDQAELRRSGTRRESGEP